MCRFGAPAAWAFSAVLGCAVHKLSDCWHVSSDAELCAISADGKFAFIANEDGVPWFSTGDLSMRDGVRIPKATPPRLARERLIFAYAGKKKPARTFIRADFEMLSLTSSLSDSPATPEAQGNHEA
jgi:hypothetical protein